MRDAGLKLTPQRRAVVAALVGNCKHPAIEQLAASVVEHTPGVSLSTVYKVVHELSSLGIVREIRVEGATRIDPDAGEHVHVVCERCGALDDVDMPAPALRAVRQAVAATGSTASHVDIVVRGVCQSCRSGKTLA